MLILEDFEGNPTGSCNLVPRCDDCCSEALTIRVDPKGNAKYTCQGCGNVWIMKYNWFEEQLT